MADIHVEQTVPGGDCRMVSITDTPLGARGALEAANHQRVRLGPSQKQMPLKVVLHSNRVGPQQLSFLNFIAILS